MRIRYTRELLATTAAESVGVNDMLRRLGVPLSGGTQSYLGRRLREYGIDTAHFAEPPRRRPRALPPERLTEAAAASTSIAGVLRALGLPDTGSCRSRVKAALLEHRIDTSHFTGAAHNKGRSTGPLRRPEELLVRRPPGSHRTRGRQLRAMLVHIGRPDVCADCGTGPVWRGPPLTLEVDHANGDWLDNRAENLRLLCPNCHATTDTYCGRNRGREAR
ncbi:HNH endonuclease [Kitasatospora sp. NPDC085879]|uniref:HNH endonuclease signature motif containing protein n=1 Tax=Kitasatospora sp. NPDC085879 TaxID=3154769 RepID=UPI00344A2A5A